MNGRVFTAGALFAALWSIAPLGTNVAADEQTGRADGEQERGNDEVVRAGDVERRDH